MVLMKKILITGVTGSGKSTVAKQLESIGCESHGIEDIEGMFAMYRKGTKEIFEDFDNSDPEKIRNSEWLCKIEQLRNLFASQKQDIAFYCGVASNMDDIFPLFDKVIVLKADSKVLHARLSTREGTDDMGGTETSRQAVLGWKDWWEETMQDKGAILLDANKSSKEIAQEILKTTS
jgi:broad-specificity NMP kinase